MAPYIYKENSIAKRCWRILAMMKDSLLIDSGLPVNFQAEAIDTSNYLCNQLLTKWNSPVFILKKAQTGIRQNLEYMQIFGNRINTFIPNKKRTKSDIQNTQKVILIDYTKTSQYLKVQALCIYQVLIASEPVVNKNKKDINLFVEHLLSPSEKPLQIQTGELKSKGRLCKKPRSKDTIIKKNASRDKLA